LDGVEGTIEVEEPSFVEGTIEVEEPSFVKAIFRGRESSTVTRDGQMSSERYQALSEFEWTTMDCDDLCFRVTRIEIREGTVSLVAGNVRNV
jgi:hypothetical protein